MGTYAYFASVFWALSLVVGTALSIQSGFTIPVYFTEQQKTLFPIWPVIDPAMALYLFMGTIAIVLLPKVLGAVLVLFRGEAAGRAGWFLLGVLIEVLFSVLIAPIFMLTQTSAVWQILRGKDSGWSVQRRDGQTFAPQDLLRIHAWHMVLGASGAVVCAVTSWYVLAWMAPIILGLLLSPYLSRLTSKAAAPWLSRALATTDTVSPPPIAQAMDRAYPDWRRRLAGRPLATRTNPETRAVNS
jgi:membrane glycosyltransferase